MHLTPWYCIGGLPTALTVVGAMCADLPLCLKATGQCEAMRRFGVHYASAGSTGKKRKGMQQQGVGAEQSNSLATGLFCSVVDQIIAEEAEYLNMSVEDMKICIAGDLGRLVVGGLCVF